MSDDGLRDVAQKWWTPDPKIVAKLPRGGNGQPTTCRVCKGYHKPGAVHLDFVGHADLTRTLIEIDPLWDWEPMAFDTNGLPLITKRGSQLVLWGHLTLLGTTRLCVGTSDDKNDADKELIGDLLRNGAMRFGIFGALWSKTDGWHDDESSAGGAEHREGSGGAEETVTASPPALSNTPSMSESIALAAANPPEKPLAAMTAGEMARYGESIGVRVSGSKADILRQLEPIVLAASGEEPWPVEGEGVLAVPGGDGSNPSAPSRPEPDAIPFEPKSFADDSGTRRKQNAAAAASVARNDTPT